MLYSNDVGDDPDRQLTGEQVVERVAAVLKAKPDAQVFVKADASLRYRDVVRAMSLLTQAGAPRVGLDRKSTRLNSSHRT